MKTHLTLAATVLLLAGCSSNDSPAADAKPKPTGSTASPTPEDTGPLKLGAPWQWDVPEIDAAGNTTALAYKQPITGISPPGIDGDTGEVWGQAEVKVCVTQGTIGVSQFPWSLAFEDGARVDVTGSSGGDFPRPEFPMDATVKTGDCVRGLIMFPVPKDQRPERIIYAPEGSTDSTEWAVPKT